MDMNYKPTPCRRYNLLKALIKPTLWGAVSVAMAFALPALAGRYDLSPSQFTCELVIETAEPGALQAQPEGMLSANNSVRRQWTEALPGRAVKLDYSLYLGNLPGLHRDIQRRIYGYRVTFKNQGPIQLPPAARAAAIGNGSGNTSALSGNHATPQLSDTRSESWNFSNLNVGDRCKELVPIRAQGGSVVQSAQAAGACGANGGLPNVSQKQVMSFAEANEQVKAGNLEPLMLPSDAEMQKALNPGIDVKVARSLLGKDYPVSLRREYVREELRGKRRQDVVVVNTASGDLFYLRKSSNSPVVVRSGQQGEEASEFGIMNWGPERYFWGVPVGSSRFVPMRILSVDSFKGPRGAVRHNLIAEFQADKGLDGLRVRQIVLLKPEEIQTLRAYPPEWEQNASFAAEPPKVKEQKGRAKAAREFFESLQPHEVAVLRLADSFGLMVHTPKPYHLSMGQFIPQSDYHSNYTQAAGGMLSGIIESILTLNFHGVLNDGTSIRQLAPLSSQSTSQDPINWLEIFTKLSPEFVIGQFGGKRAFDADVTFSFVVTEDGQLIIAPTGQTIKGTLQGVSLSLAGSRYILASGRFIYKGLNKVELELNSHGYDFETGISNRARDSFHGGKTDQIWAFVVTLFTKRLGIEIVNPEEGLNITAPNNLLESLLPRPASLANGVRARLGYSGNR